MRKPHGYASATHHHDFPDFVGAFATYFADLVHIIARGGEIEYVAFLNFVVASRDDGLVMAAYGRHVVVVLVEREVAQFAAYQRGVVAQFHSHHNQLAVVQFEPVAHPGSAKGCDNLLGREHFGINEVVNPFLHEKFSVVAVEEFVVVDAGHGFFRPQAFGYLARH